MLKDFWPLTWIIALLLLGSISTTQAQTTDVPTMEAVETLLLDDFQSGDGRSSFGTPWSGFTDQVMGGLSEMNLGYQALVDGRLSLRMQGEVRLENNGGFIQARLPLETGSGRFDASAWDGVRVIARGAPGAYYIHLRTRASWLPWQYYGARIPLEADQDWAVYDIPFSEFKGESTRRRLDISTLKSIAIVAYGEAFDADIEVIELSFYRLTD